VVQPLLALFGANPEFFVAGRYSTSQLVMFALAVALVPPAVGVGATALAGAISRRAGDVVYAVVVAVLSAALVLAVLRTIGLESAALVFVLAAFAGVALAALVVRTTGGRLLASFLAVANVFFVGSFLLLGETSQLVTGGGPGDFGRVDVPTPGGPIVWVILDELPATTIMRTDGSINAERYPGFAELADVSSWYRNASSQYNLTHRAVPAQLTGTLGDDDDLPNAQSHPRSIFSLFGNALPVDRYESVTDLCPTSVCDPGPRRSLRQALKDASIVFGHRVLPAAVRDELPPIDNSWGAYGAEDDGGGAGSTPVEGGDRPANEQEVVNQAYEKWRELGADERSPLGQAGLLREQIEAIGPEPGLHFAHVALPHRPWTLSASGISTSYEPELITEPAAAGYEFGARLDAQLHAMQVGAADVIVGDLVEHLRSLPTWEETLLVVTSDHGTNLTAPNIGRMRINDDNREEIYRVPLFIKAPGQVEGEGEIHDESAQTLDILPTVIDLLGGETDWDFDGHSLVDGSAASTEPQVSTDFAAVLEITDRRAEQFPHGDDWLAVAAVGPNGDLVGDDVADLATGEPSAYSASLEQADLLAELPTVEATAPFVLAGIVRGADDPPNGELVAAINGRLAGVVGGWRPADDGWAFTGYVADLYREGANDVELYEVTRPGAEPTLHLVEQEEADS